MSNFAGTVNRPAEILQARTLSRRILIIPLTFTRELSKKPDRHHSLRLSEAEADGREALIYLLNSSKPAVQDNQQNFAYLWSGSCAMHIMVFRNSEMT